MKERPLVTKWCLEEEEEEKKEEEEPPDLSLLDGDTFVFSGNQLEDAEQLTRGLKSIELDSVITTVENPRLDSSRRAGKKINSSFGNAAQQTGNANLAFDTRPDLILENVNHSLAKSEQFAENFVELENLQNNFAGPIKSTHQQTDQQAVFDSIILSKLKNESKSKIKIEKAENGRKHQNNQPIAKVLKHKDKPISHTILIKNTPEAHKLFGIRNAPNLAGSPLAISTPRTKEEILDIEKLPAREEEQEGPVQSPSQRELDKFGGTAGRGGQPALPSSASGATNQGTFTYNYSFLLLVRTVKDVWKSLLISGKI